MEWTRGFVRRTLRRLFPCFLLSVGVTDKQIHRFHAAGSDHDMHVHQAWKMQLTLGARWADFNVLAFLFSPVIRYRLVDAICRPCLDNAFRRDGHVGGMTACADANAIVAITRDGMVAPVFGKPDLHGLRDCGA